MNSSDREYLEARFKDAIRDSDRRSTPKFVGFLDASGAALAVTVATREKAKWSLFGGYTEAERVYFGVFPDRCEPDGSYFPITKLKIVNKSSRALEHRDILGALMSAGIERDTVGDILPGEKHSVVFVADTVAEYIVNEISKIAACGVEISVDTTEFLPETKGFTEMSDTVASLRLDCVVSALACCSRSAASEYIVSGAVSLCGIEVLKPTKEVAAGDIIAIRKKGKFVIDGVSDLTKKGRTVLKYRKYN